MFSKAKGPERIAAEGLDSAVGGGSEMTFENVEKIAANSSGSTTH